MVRKKSTCDGCGKLFINSKLISIPGSCKRYCGWCRKREIKKMNNIKFKTFEEHINSNTINLSEFDKKLIRMAKFNTNYLTKDETVFLKDKYSKDIYKNRDIGNLKNNLRITTAKINNNKYNRIKEFEKAKEINNNFKNSFMKLK